MAKTSPKSHPLFVIKRLLPTIIGLHIIGSFLIHNPTQAERLLSQVTQRFTQKTSTVPSLPSAESVLDVINQKRLDQSLAPLTLNQSLVELARILSLDIATNPDRTPTLDLEKTASSLSIKYDRLASLVLIQSPSSIQSLQEMLTSTDSDAVLLSNRYQQSGIASVKSPDHNNEIITVIALASPSKNPKKTFTTPTPTSFYTGTQLWTEIQRYRKDKGVPEFRQDNTLCTLTSIRVNQLITLGRLDDHAGFEPLVDQYKDSGKLTFGNLGENILTGYPTAQAAVAAWDGSLGHKALMSDGSYVWACASANHGYAVLIAAY